MPTCGELDSVRSAELDLGDSELAMQVTWSLDLDLLKLRDRADSFREVADSLLLRLSSLNIDGDFSLPTPPPGLLGTPAAVARQSWGAMERGEAAEANSLGIWMSEWCCCSFSADFFRLDLTPKLKGDEDRPGLGWQGGVSGSLVTRKGSLPTERVRLAACWAPRGHGELPHLATLSDLWHSCCCMTAAADPLAAARRGPLRGREPVPPRLGSGRVACARALAQTTLLLLKAEPSSGGPTAPTAHDRMATSERTVTMPMTMSGASAVGGGR